MIFGTVGIAMALISALFFVSLQGYQWLNRWQNKPMLLRVILEHGNDYLRQPAASTHVMFISFYFHVHNSMTFYLLLRYGAGVDISIPELFVVLTLVNLVAVLPVSINGLGVVDIAFVFLLGVYGVDSDSSLSVMLISRMLLILVSLIGAAFYLSERKELPKQMQSPGLVVPQHQLPSSSSLLFTQRLQAGGGQYRRISACSGNHVIAGIQSAKPLPGVSGNTADSE